MFSQTRPQEPERKSSTFGGGIQKPQFTDETELPDNKVPVNDGLVIESPRMPTGRERRKPKHGEQIPEQGIPALQYKFNLLINRGDKVPAMSEKEQRALRVIRIAKKEQYVWTLSRFLPQLTISICNSKGTASKSTTGVNLAEIIAWLTKVPTLMMPSTTNTVTSANLSKKAGIDIRRNREALTLSRVHRNIDVLRSGHLSDHFMKTASRTASGLWVICQDVRGEKENPTATFRVKFGEIADLIMGSTNYRILDHGNDDIVAKSTDVSAIQMSDVLIFTATNSTDTQDTLDSLEPTMSSYMDEVLGLDEEFLSFDGKELPNLAKIQPVPTAEKVRRSIVLISGLEKQDPREFERYCAKLSEDGEPGSERINSEGALMGVPKDSYLASGKPVNKDKLRPQTYEAYLTLVIAAFEQGLLQKNQELPKERPDEALAWLPQRQAV